METLSFVIPVHNAECTIGHLCATLIGLYKKDCSLDIILVNDGSTDSSDAVCRQLHQDHPEIVSYVRLTRNFGEHNAVMAGLHHVRGDYCVIMDDDFQNPPTEVSKLIREIRNGYDVVYAQYRTKRDAWFRNFGSWINDKMANIILKKPSGLYLSSFKIMNRFLVKEIVKNDNPEPYIDGIILRTTNSIGRVGIEHSKRKQGASGYTFKKLIGLWGSMVVNHSMVPLRIIGMTGTFLVVVGVAYGLYKAYDDVGSGVKLSNYESLMFANVVFRGLVLLALSIVGEYIGRIHLSLSSDPQFVVRERLLAKHATNAVAYLKER